jgi:hypothetical protein
MNQRFPIVTSGEIYHRIVSSETVIRISLYHLNVLFTVHMTLMGSYDTI